MLLIATCNFREAHLYSHESPNLHGQRRCYRFALRLLNACGHACHRHQWLCDLIEEIAGIFFFAERYRHKLGDLGLVVAPTAAAPSSPPSADSGNTDAAAPASTPPGQSRAEIMRLWTADFSNNEDVGTADKAYLAQVVTARTGLSREDAEKRVNDVIVEAKADADAARKGAAKLSLWLTAAMLFGAFAAGLAAVEGGSLRDGTWNDRVLTPRTI